MVLGLFIFRSCHTFLHTLSSHANHSLQSLFSTCRRSLPTRKENVVVTTRLGLYFVQPMVVTRSQISPRGGLSLVHISILSHRNVVMMFYFFSKVGELSFVLRKQ